MSTTTGSATPSLPFSLPESPAPVPETPDPQHESLSEDGLISDRNLASEDHSLEVGDDTLFGFTYKTSRFDMPLFNIVGVTSTAMNMSFFVGFYFFDVEDGEGFKWALERLRDLYDELGIRHPTAIVSGRES
jgi:MULE transposase-like protein